ncbi:MAG: helix-turn-helix transcriptional regulator [Candidatus Thorarchaeota archaeon]|nr:MAG: helix-turn-helix transcriptional regulator [Candidatus Thorarchaeota archaeon]
MECTAMIVNRIRELREEKMRSSSESEQWTQEGMAKRLGVSRQTVISMEKGTYNPSLILAFKLARAFGMAIEDIFEYRDDDNET